MRRWNAFVLSMLLCSCFFCAPMAVSAAESESGEAKTEAVQDAPTVKQLRGKLLYKRNQIRKLERAACAADDELQTKVASLESQIQGLYSSAEPKLESLYQEEKALQHKIEEATPKK